MKRRNFIKSILTLLSVPVSVLTSTLALPSTRLKPGSSGSAWLSGSRNPLFYGGTIWTEEEKRVLMARQTAPVVLNRIK